MNLRLFACFLFVFSAAHAIEGTLQGRIGCFHFSDHLAQKIYSDALPDIELEGNIQVRSNMSVWSNLNYVWKSGRSTEFGDKTHLDLATWSTGANLYIPVKRSSASFYLGLGISGAYVHTKDEGGHVPPNTHKLGVGTVFKLGVYIPWIRELFVNPFFDYYYQPIGTQGSAASGSVDLGGFRTGIGVGYRFR